MFKRREPHNLITKLKEFIWPSMGWKRSFIYIKHRLVRLSDSTHKIAIGFAIGTAVSFTPIVGTHFIQAGFFTYLVRGNLLSSIIGTFIGNPWTFPLIWWASINFGAFLFSVLGLPADATLPPELSFHIFMHILWNDPIRVLLPWTVGGYIAGLISLPITYIVFYKLIKSAKVARAKARLRKVRRAAREVTGQ